MPNLPRFQSTGGPLARVLAVIVPVLMFTAAMVVGAVFAVALVAVLLVVAAVVGARRWWLRLRGGGGSGPHRADPNAPIEGEYRVIDDGGEGSSSSRGAGSRTAPPKVR